MKFVVNRYNMDFHAVITDPPPIPGAKVERLLYGLPPFEFRFIWTIDINDFAQLLEVIERSGVSLDMSKSAFWNKPDAADPGDRLFGISLVDDPNYEIDPSDRPRKIP